MAHQEKIGYKEYIAPYSVIYGATNQGMLKSEYPGLQCTSMALASVIYYNRMGWTNYFNPYDVNRILVEGNDLHSKLRDQHHLSSNIDGMIGISDLPYRELMDVGIMFDLNTEFRLTEDSTPLFINGGRNAFLGNLTDFITTYRPGKPVGFLLTIRSFTYSVLRLAYGAYALVDSHGHAKIHGSAIGDGAGVVVCPTLFHLIKLILGMYDPMEQCDIAPVTCEQTRAYSRELTPEERIPCPEEMDNPYVGLMAH